MVLKITRFDLYRSERYINRLAIIDKLRINNSFSIPGFDKIVLTINLDSLSDFDDIKLVSSAFALFLITGQRPYIVRFGVFQTFHSRSCDVILAVTVSDKINLFRVFQFLGCKALSSISKHDLSITEYSGGNCTGVFFSIANLNFLRVVETHFIFFRWYEKLHIKISTFFPSFSVMYFFFSFFKFFKRE